MPGKGGGRKRSASGVDAAGGKRPAQVPDAAGERHAVVAIDIGHHGTAWAYAWKSDFDENVRAFALTGQPLTVSKDPTCVLLDENNQFVAFGDDARRRALAPGQDLSKIKLFENFKMQLKDMGRTEPTTVPDIGADKSPVFVRILLQGMLSEVFRAASKLLGETPGPPGATVR